MKRTAENSIKKNNNILKIGGLIILVLATQLSTMFIYERYIRRSMVQEILDKQHAVQLLLRKYKENNILPNNQIISDERLDFWEKIDIFDPEDQYEKLIDQMEKGVDNCMTDDMRNALKSEIEKAKAHKKELITFFSELISILKS